MHCKTVTILTADSTGTAFWTSSEISMAEYGSCGNFIHRHSPPYLFLSREGGDDSKDIAKPILVWFSLPFVTYCQPQHAKVEIKTPILYQAINSCGQILQDVFRYSGKGMKHYDPKQVSNKANPIPNFC